ncbi:MAG: hypothetical protein WD042_18560 [Phycisphaeraceae bacterium]
MTLFQRLCRNVGLMVHNIKHPEGGERHEVKRTVEEKPINEKMTLRRTTIDEVEIKQDDNDTK